jgi:hypothetical protein
MTPLWTVHSTEPYAHVLSHVHVEGVTIYNVNDRSAIFGGAYKLYKSY